MFCIPDQRAPQRLATVEQCPFATAVAVDAQEELGRDIGFCAGDLRVTFRLISQLANS